MLYVRGQQPTTVGSDPAMSSQLPVGYGCLHPTVTDLSSCSRNNMGSKAKNIYSPALAETVCHLCCTSPTFLPEGLITLEDSVCEGLDTAYLPSFSGLLQKDTP